MANGWPRTVKLLALALAFLSAAALGQSAATSGATENPLREPAPASQLETSEASLPPPLENSPAMQFVSAMREAPPSGNVEILPRPTGPQWQGEPPAWIRHGAAPLSPAELPPESPADLPPTGPAMPAPLAGDYPPRFKMPLSRESWMFRPFHLDAFAGTLLADTPIRHRVDAGTGFYTGFRFGWDMSKHFGVETSFGFSKVGNDYPQIPNKMGDEKLFLWDVDWLWYPWGDTRFRPYLLLGTGLNDVNFVNDINQRVHSTLYNLPWGGGFKYRFGNRLAFRFDVRDNVTYGGASGLDLMHNVSLTGNMEWHFGGGPKRSYWPWNPGNSWW